jgi:hypothetical protein
LIDARFNESASGSPPPLWNPSRNVPEFGVHGSVVVVCASVVVVLVVGSTVVLDDVVGSVVVLVVVVGSTVVVGVVVVVDGSVVAVVDVTVVVVVEVSSPNDGHAGGAWCEPREEPFAVVALHGAAEERAEPRAADRDHEPDASLRRAVERIRAGAARRQPNGAALGQAGGSHGAGLAVEPEVEPSRAGGPSGPSGGRQLQ